MKQIIVYNIQMSLGLTKYLAHLGKEGGRSLGRFVIGNSSVDYDSFFGSIIFAYLLTTTTGKLHQPIIDCSRQDLNLRFQIMAVLQRSKIDPSGLVFRGASETLPEGEYSLYDHNERDVGGKIEYIVDHHSYLPEKIKARKYLIANMGSGLTLLYYQLFPSKLGFIDCSAGKQEDFIEKFMKFTSKEPFQFQTSNQYIDNEIKRIIAYGIKMDSFNFDEKMKDRWTIFDKKAIQFIESDINQNLSTDWLQSAKFDKTRNKNLTLHQSLTKDKKQFSYGSLKVAYSIIYLNPEQFCHHYKAFIQSQLNLESSIYDIYFLMSIFQNEEQKFERRVIFKSRQNYKGMVDKSLGMCFSGLQMVEMDEIGGWSHWKDPSVTISRKKLQPLIRQHITKALQ